MTIVCVDDHPIMLKGLSNNIRQILPDASIGAFENANDAIGFVKENGCDILVSEIELSGVDGLTLSKSIKIPHVLILLHCWECNCAAKMKNSSEFP